MRYTIEKMNHVLKYQDDNKKWTSLDGYAFIDKSGYCIMIVYGENRRDWFSKYLNDNGDPLGIKYKIINLLP